MCNEGCLAFMARVLAKDGGLTKTKMKDQP